MMTDADTTIKAEEPTAVCYRFRWDDGEISYIGNTTNLIQRMKNHRANWKIWEPFWVDVMPVPRRNRFQIETALIRRYRPRNNHFVASYDNEYKFITETWTPALRVFPDSNNKFGTIIPIRETQP